MDKVKMLLANVLYENMPLIIVSAVFLVLFSVVIALIPNNINFALIAHSTFHTCLKIILANTTLTYCILIGLKNVNFKPAQNLEILTPKNIVSAFIAIIFLTINAASFCSLKAFIPFINKYSWDPLLIKADYLIAFNHHPWLLLQNTFSATDKLEYLSNYIYFSWFIINYLVIWWQIISKDRFLRMQFLVSWSAAWLILGLVVATLFSSVGPCFYEYFYDTPQPFVRNINNVIYEGKKDNSFNEIRGNLLNSYKNKDFTPGSGISAFPSLHVGICVINCLTISKRLPKLNFLAIIYILLVVFSCIYSGLHYLVDCIAGATGAAIIWYLTGLILKVNNWSSKNCKDHVL